MRDLNYNHLYYFFTIASQGSIVKASKKLHLTQPTLSGQLRQFEEFLGKKLFDRKVRKLVLNEEGLLVLDYARKIFGLGEEMVRSIQKKNASKVHIVRIGMLPSLSKTLIHRFILPFFEEEGIVIKVREATLPYLLRELETDNFEFILSDSPAPKTGRKFDSYDLRQRHFIAVGTSKFLKLKNKFPSSLTNVPFATFTEHSQIRAEVDHYFKVKGIQPKIIAEFDDIVLLQFVAERGKCVTILPKHCVAEALDSKRLIELGSLPHIKSEVWAIARKGDRESQQYLRMLRT